MQTIWKDTKMGILITKVRIENYRSIENMEVSLSGTNVIIGANNSGKSNFLRAINISLGQNRIVSSEDIHINFFLHHELLK